MARGDIVLRVEGKDTGPISGESLQPPGAIDVLEWSWRMTGPSSLGGSGPASRCALSELRLTKSVDKASTPLLNVMRSNEVIKKAVLTVRKSGSVPPVDFLIVTLERARLTAIDISTVAPGEPTLVEHLSLAFEKIEIAYAGQSGTGSKQAASVFTAAIT